jgi:hypothetical protein
VLPSSVAVACISGLDCWVDILGFKGEQNKNESPSFRHNFIASSSPPPAVPWLNVTYSFGSITNQEPNGSLQIKQKKQRMCLMACLASRKLGLWAKLTGQEHGPNLSSHRDKPTRGS